MGTGVSINSQSTSIPVVRRRSFRAYNVIFGSFVIAVMYLLLKELNRLSFTAAVALGAAAFILLRLWHLAASRYESIAIVLAAKRDSPPEKSIEAALSASTNAIKTGAFMTCMLVLMFLLAISQILSRR